MGDADWDSGGMIFADEIEKSQLRDTLCDVQLICAKSAWEAPADLTNLFAMKNRRYNEEKE